MTLRVGFPTELSLHPRQEELRIESPRPLEPENPGLLRLDIGALGFELQRISYSALYGLYFT